MRTNTNEVIAFQTPSQQGSMKITCETIHPGEWGALISIYGYEYSVSFINSELRIYKVAGPQRIVRWKTQSHVKQIKKYFWEIVVPNLGGDVFLTTHKELYANT